MGAHHKIGVGTGASQEKIPRWKANVRMSGPGISRGAPFHLAAEVEIVDPDILRFLRRAEEVYMVAVLSPLYDDRGRYRSFTNIQTSCLLTPSGLPVETLQENLPSAFKEDHYRTPFEVVDARPPKKALKGRNTLRFAADSVFPAAVADGRYRIAIEFGAKLRGHMIKLELLPYLGSIMLGEEKSRSLFLTANATEKSKIFVNHSPVITVGDPAPARMPWTLFGGVDTHGTRGVTAREDRDSFAINYTGLRFGRLILPKDDAAGRPITYRLEPDFPTQSVSQDMFEKTYYQDFKTVLTHIQLDPVKLDYSSGELEVSVRTPSGRVYNLGGAPFSGKSDYGGTTNSGKFDFAFEEYGHHIITMKGFINDVDGNAYHGGGAYDVWIALPLSLSTSCKPGMPFTVGNAYSPRVTVHPSFPAELEYEVKLFRNSSKTDVKAWKHKGRANNYGYYFPRDEFEPMVFDSPGEYIAEVTASHTDEKGRLWIGNQVSASVVAPADSPLKVHGDRMGAQSHPFSPDAPFGFRSRYELYAGGHAGTPEINDMTLTQIRMQLPYNHEDVMFFSPGTPTNVNEVFPHLSYSTGDGAVTRAALKTFPPFEDYMLKNFGLTMKDMNECWGDYYAVTGCRPFLLNAADLLLHKSRDNLPVMSIGKKSLQPFAFQDDIKALNYYYTSVIRPGMLCRQTISDSTNTSNYWIVTPNYFARQFGAGENGDSVGDMYRFMGGVVYRSLETGKNMYGIYHSSGMVADPRNEDNRVEAPFKSPLVTAGGVDYYMFPGMSPEAGTIYETGDRIVAGGFAFPAAKMDYEFRIATPGGKTIVEKGSADEYGLFNLLRGGLKVEETGVYKVFFKLKRGRLEGATVGKPDGWYYLYGVDRDTPCHIELDLPEAAEFDPAGALEITGALPKDWASGKVYFTVVTPGHVYSDGEIEVRNGKFTYRLMPLHLSVFFEKNEVFDVVNNKPGYWDTVVISFFAEGVTRAGGKGTAASQVVVRGDMVFAQEGRKLAGPPPKLAPDKMYARFPIDSSSRVYEAGDSAYRQADLSDKTCAACHSAGELVSGKITLKSWKKAAYWLIEKSPVLKRRHDGCKANYSRSESGKLINKKCAPCHTADELIKKGNSLEGWKRTVNWHMEKNPLWLREHNRRELVFSLYSMYPPRKQPEREKPLLSRGGRVLREKCRSCHKKEPVTDRWRSRKGWDNILTRHDYWNIKVKGKSLYKNGDRKLLLDYLDLVSGSEAVLPSSAGKDTPRKHFQQICFRCHSSILGSYNWARADRGAVERHIKHKLGGASDEENAMKALQYVFKKNGKWRRGLPR